MIGNEIYNLLKEIFPICRSITGEGNRETLKIIQKVIPLQIHEVPTGYQAYDWEIPEEWNVNDAYVLDPDGNKVIDFKKHNLHLVGYSVPVDKEISLEELQAHLYSIPDKPDAIPYVTSYYEKKWGFCLKHKDREKLKDGVYKVFIDSKLEKGSMTYGELIIPGKTKEEIFLTTYICHPSMANNEASGPAVATFLAKWILQKKRKYTYRIVFAPETIGAVMYISKNYDALVNNVAAGFNITCVGDNNNLSFLPSRNGDTVADKVARHVLKNYTESYKEYSFLTKGSDERQYCHPKVDLPLVSIMRTKYGEYSEYHTSLDNLDFVNPEGLEGSYDIIKDCIDALEKNVIYDSCIICEPKMKKRGLSPKNWHLRHIDSKTDIKKNVVDMMNVIYYCDGKNDLVDVANKVNLSLTNCYEYAKLLESKGVIREVC